MLSESLKWGMVRDEPGSHEDLQEFVALTLKLIGNQWKFCLLSRVRDLGEEVAYSFRLNGVEIGEMRGLLEANRSRWRHAQ